MRRRKHSMDKCIYSKRKHRITQYIPTLINLQVTFVACSQEAWITSWTDSAITGDFFSSTSSMLLTVQAFSGIFLFLLGRGPWSTVCLWAEWFLMLGLMLTSRDHSQANPTNLLQRPGDSVIPRPTGLQSPSITLPKSVTLMTRVETFPMSHSKEILNFIIKCVPKHRDCQ